MNTAFLGAAVLSMATAGVHVFVGGVRVARPLLECQELPRVSRCLNYYCWHIVSVLLVVQAGGFLWAAAYPHGVELAILFTGLDLVFAAMSVWAAMRERVPPWKLPALTLFLLTAVTGLAGIVQP